MRILLIILALLPFGQGHTATIVVGPGKQVRTLRQGIDLARNGDTILLLKGIYKEGAITLTKSISIIGQGYPVLEGEKKYEILLISASGVLVRGIEFRNSGYSALNDYASIKLVDCSNVTLENNRIFNAYFGIHVSNSVHTTIRNNLVQGIPGSEQLTGNAIHLWKSDKALVEQNHLIGHRDGIYFEFVTGSVIRNNLSENNVRYGLHFMFSNNDSYLGNTFRNNGAGVAVMYSNKVKMERNLFDQNWGPSAYGILLKDISDSEIRNNRFRRNTIGIHMEGSSRIAIQQNAFSYNGWAIKVQASCDDNEFYRNNFIGNSFDVGTNGTMMLNRFSNNYWDKYEGYDLNKDGIGDIPYRPVSLYSMIIEQNPTTLMLLRSFTVSLLDKAEKAIPGITPEGLVDNQPVMKKLKL